jgi:hypothetical protein
MRTQPVRGLCRQDINQYSFGLATGKIVAPNQAVQRRTSARTPTWQRERSLHGCDAALTRGSYI